MPRRTYARLPFDAALVGITQEGCRQRKTLSSATNGRSSPMAMEKASSLGLRNDNTQGAKDPRVSPGNRKA